MEYRTPSADEADRFWELTDRLDHETNYMLYAPGERPKDLSAAAALLRDAAEGGDFFLVAEAGGRMIGYISAQRGRMHRIAHSAYIVVGILRDHRGQGIGAEFFKRLDAWAEEKKITRLELTVICENEAAKRLYLKSGFQIEGVKRNSVCVDGRYLDEYYMAKIR